MNVSYPMANNLPDLDSLIDEKVNRILNQITEVSNQAKINVQFLSKSSNKKKTGWFGNSTYNVQDNLVVWESWLINVESLPLDQVSNGESKMSKLQFKTLQIISLEYMTLQINSKNIYHQSHRLIVLRSPTKLLYQRKVRSQS